MIKAKAFLKFICEDYGFRFFSGVPSKGFKGIFNAMDKTIMHYIPAANENIALAMASGAASNGVASAIFIDYSEVVKLDFSKNILFNIPLLVIAFMSEDFKYKKSSDSILLSDKYEKDVSILIDRFWRKGKVSSIYFKEGQLL